MKPKVFIASPLFNKPQIQIISTIEGTLHEAGFDFYSARLHSGSDKLSPEDRKDLRKWDPVFESNLAGLDECQVCIAVLEYTMPDGQRLTMQKREHHINPDPSRPGSFFPDTHEWSASVIELPDAGTVWEMGYMRAQGKLVVGFHTDKAKHLNLMLSHGVDGMLLGYDALRNFLNPPKTSQFDSSDVIQKLAERTAADSRVLSLATWFDWSACHVFDAQNKEVE